MTANSPQNLVRFTAGSEGLRGAIWTLWTGPKGDVYVAAHGLLGDLKLSLHASGDWRHAFAQQHYAKPDPIGPPKKHRVIKKWRRPPPFAADHTRAFHPHEHIVTPFDMDVLDDDVALIPRPGAKRETYFTGILGPRVPGWPGRDSMGTRLLHQENLGNGERLWLLWHGETMPVTRRAALGEVCSMLRPEIAAAPVPRRRDATHRIFAFGVEDGTGLVNDLSVPVVCGDAT